MKKIVCLMIIMLCTFSIAISFAEEFTLRNGIKFGDSVETVKEKETLEIKNEGENEIRTASGELAGVNVDAIVYRFDEGGKLVSVLWEVLNDGRNPYFPQKKFDSLNTALIKKYGVPDNTDTQSFFIIQGAAIEEMMKLAQESSLFQFSMALGIAGPVKQSEWQIESKDNQNVKIDLLYYKVYDEDYRIRLSYDLYTDEELEEQQRLKESEENNVQDDL